MEKNNKSKKIIVSLALILSFSAFDKAVAQEWQPNSIEKIEASIREDNKKYNEKEYDIRWGDYLYGISQATKVDIDTLAQINSIANKNLIIAGNKLYYGTNSNIVTKDSDGNTRVFQEQRYDGTKKVEEAPKNKLTGKEEKQIVEDNPSLAKDFNSKDKIDKKIVKENKEQIKDLDKDIKDLKKDKKDLKKDKKDLQKQKDKLIKDGEEKNKDKIAEIDKKIKETDKKIDSKEKQKDYLQTENDKIEAEKKGDKDKADKKQKELEDKKDNDPYEIWKKEQKEKNPDLKDEDLTKEQYEIWKKNKDKKPDVKPEKPSEPEKPANPEKPGKDDKEDPKKPDEKPDEKPGKDDPKDPEEKPEEKPNPDEPKKPENPKKPEDKPEEPKDPKKPSKPDEKPEDEVVVKEVYEEVPFNTVRAINDPNLKTRVFQKGVNGKDLYKVTYKNGEFVKKDFVKTVSKPVDEIIQSYVKVKDAEYETRYKMRFFSTGIPREDYESMPMTDWKTIIGEDEAAADIMYNKYAKTYYFDTYEEADAYTSQHFVLGSFGSADSVEETVKVSDEVWEWQ